MIKSKIKILLTLIFLFLGLKSSFSQSNDTIRKLKKVVVNSKGKSVHSTSPVQFFNQEKISKIGALQLSDAVKFFSGVVVKDYAGIGGLKTVSVRGFGANHTAVNYDGITVTNIQTGQVDIGRFTTQNLKKISLNSGITDDIFQTARNFASSSTLNITTQKPTFSTHQRTKGSVSLKIGSWKFLNPTFSLQQKINDRIVLSANGNFLKTGGNYPYRLHYGFLGKDSTSNEKRKNSDVQKQQLETSLFMQFSKNQKARIKLFYQQSERGLPNATIFYNTQNYSSQRLWNKDFFVQGFYKNQFSKKWALMFNFKYYRGYLRYLDPHFNNLKGKEENRYIQQEFYLSNSLKYTILNNFLCSFSNDVVWTNLQANFPNFAYPKRFSYFSNFAVKYIGKHFKTTANLLSTTINESVKKGQSAQNHQHFSPYVGISIQPFLSHDLRVRAFYKNSFRMPTFNDLYYQRIGNPNLQPEKANQFNFGVAYQTDFKSINTQIMATFDVYHNRVKNKIVAYPTKNIFVWTMLNYGEVTTDGFDANLQGIINFSKKKKLTFSTSYSYQKALNTTDKNNRSYGHQIPYVPRVAISNITSFETPNFTFSHSFLWSGKRYALPQNYRENRLFAYAEHNFTLLIPYNLKKRKISIKIEILNAFNKNYSVVRYFPMPQRSWRIGMKYLF